MHIKPDIYKHMYVSFFLAAELFWSKNQYYQVPGIMISSFVLFMFNSHNFHFLMKSQGFREV